MRTRRRRLMPMAVVLPLLLFASSCASHAPQTTLKPKGPIARSIDHLFNGVFWVAVFVFFVVELGAIFLVLRSRQRKDDPDPDGLPPQTHGNFRLEIAWTIVPAVMLAIVAFATLTTLFNIDRQDKNAMTVQVTGQQWFWEYKYDTNGDGKFTDADVRTDNDLVIPAGQDINLVVRSNDVIHSFWIPALNGKKDAVPNRHSPLRINADQPGVYVGQCTEFCGLSHGYMRQRVVAMTPANFQSWLDNQKKDAVMPTDPDALAGAKLFTTQCSACHLARGINDAQFAKQGHGTEFLQSGNAPDLTHFASRGVFAGSIFDLWVDTNKDGIVEPSEIGGTLNRGALEAWLRNPPAQKPMYAPALPEPGSGKKIRGMPNLHLQEGQIDQLVAYLQTLK
jgi:cytochrome c oxidase subunit II